MTDIEEKLKPYLFPVKETQVLVHDIDNYGLRPTDKYKAIVRSDNDNLVSIMRDTYKLIPNREIVLPLIDQLNNIDSKWYIDDSHSFSEDSRMRLQVTFPDLTFHDGRSDFALSLFLHNSYDGSEGVRMFWGALRFICGNGMVFGHVLSKFYGRHTSGLDISNLKESLEKTYSQIPVIQHRIEILQNLKADKSIKRKVEDNLGKNVMKYVEEQPNAKKSMEVVKFINILH